MLYPYAKQSSKWHGTIFDVLSDQIPYIIRYGPPECAFNKFEKKR